MINYIRHDHEFYGVAKLSSGDEVMGVMIATKEEGQTLVFVQDPATPKEAPMKRGDEVGLAIGLVKWMMWSDEEFFILREKDIVTVASMSKEITVMYEAFILGEDISNKKISRSQTNVKDAAGYVGKIDEARKMFEKIYKENKS